MYRKYKKRFIKTDINNKHKILTTEGETLEKKLYRIIHNREPITDSAPLIYTPRKDGVRPETDIRTDRFDVAIDAMDLRSKNHITKRQERIDRAMGKDKDGKSDQGKTEGKTEGKTGDAGTSQATNS